MTAALFDDDQFDREVIAGRLPADDFTVHELCDRYGVSRAAFMKAKARGIIPPAAYQSAVEPYECHWTALQVAEMDLRGGLGRHRHSAPCGTYAAYRRHQYRREAIDILCRMAARRYHRERRR